MAEDLRHKGEAYWRQKLTPEQFNVMRERGTEAPWTGLYIETKDSGTYKCAGCGQELFSSEAKYDSGCGWPTFYDVMNNDRVEFREDSSFGQERTEVVCARCGGHLGHVFDDGPADKGGQRYCVNSVALKFQAQRAAR